MGCTATRASYLTGLFPSKFNRQQVGRDGHVVRLTTLQSTSGNDTKRARVEGGAEVAQKAQEEKDEEQAPKEELSLAVQAEKAVAELGSAAGWDEEVRARCVLRDMLCWFIVGFGHLIVALITNNHTRMMIG